MDSELRSLPSVDRVMSAERLRELEKAYPHTTLVGLVRQRLEEVRQLIRQGSPAPSMEELVNSIDARIQAMGEPGPRRVINATGVILHTNLGRAPLSTQARQAMDEVSKGFINLEFDLATGKRGSRQAHVESLICQLTGAEAALVVNNNASAVLLALAALAKRKEVIMSRGQVVEIGGGFRIPEVMRQSGARLVEVGTTNRTYVTDYEQAISPRTAALLRVHSSNFRVVGFSQSVEIKELVELGHRHLLPVFDDIGSGCLIDAAQFGLAAEPLVQDSLADGAALVMFSGDKLLGGPQAGIIAGKKELVARLSRHPLVRALRIDKGRLAALSVTLLHYLKGEALTHIPVWQMISAPLDEIERKAQAWAYQFEGMATVVDGESMVGGGSLPGSTLPTKLLMLKAPNRIQQLAQELRHQEPAVIARIEKNALLIDPRTVLPGEEQEVLRALQRVLTGKASSV